MTPEVAAQWLGVGVLAIGLVILLLLAVALGFWVYAGVMEEFEARQRH